MQSTALVLSLFVASPVFVVSPVHAAMVTLTGETKVLAAINLLRASFESSAAHECSEGVLNLHDDSGIPETVFIRGDEKRVQRARFQSVTFHTYATSAATPPPAEA